MPSESQALSLIEGIYDTALDPDGWPDFLARLAQSLGGTAAQLLHHEPRAPHGAIVLAHCDTDPQGVREYGEYYGTIDPWVLAARARGLMQAGRVVVGDELVPHRDFLRTEYHADFARRYGAVRLLAVSLAVEGSVFSNLSVNRPASRPPFGNEERDLLQCLVPHLRRALLFDRRIGDHAAARACASAVLDRMPLATVVLSASGKPMHVNEAAQAILRQNDGLHLGPQGLQATLANESVVLADLVRSAAVAAPAVTGQAGGVMRISRPSHRQSYVVTVTRLRGRELARPDKAGCAVAVVLQDPERRITIDEEVLRTGYGLTRAEAAVAADVAAGFTLQESATRRGVKEATVRWHFKHVLSKTETSTQAQLVSLLLSGGAVLLPANASASPSR